MNIAFSGNNARIRLWLPVSNGAASTNAVLMLLKLYFLA